jgi:sortase A
MDDYFVMEEAELTGEDLERRGSRKRRFGTIFLILGAVAAAAAIILTIYNYKDDYDAGESALADLHGMEEMLGIDADGDGKIGTTPAEEYYKAHNMGNSGRAAALDSARGEASGHAPVYEVHPEMTMPTVEVDGNTYVGFLDIPAIERTLPVMDTWSYPNLKIAPNRFVGTAYAHDMIICAHNYDRHFGQIKNLQPGDKVTFTDVYGDRFDYEVSEVTILQPTDVEEMKDPDDWDLTLFTCTIGGATRVTVRCVMKGSTEGTWNTAAKADLSEKIAALQRQSETQKQT